MLAGLLGWAHTCWAQSGTIDQDVNLASQAELEMIKGIGPGLSEAILAARRERPFADWQDFVQRMSGIGPTRASRLSAAGLRIGGQAWPQADAPH